MKPQTKQTLKTISTLIIVIILMLISSGCESVTTEPVQSQEPLESINCETVTVSWVIDPAIENLEGNLVFIQYSIDKFHFFNEYNDIYDSIKCESIELNLNDSVLTVNNCEVVRLNGCNNISYRKL